MTFFLIAAEGGEMGEIDTVRDLTRMAIYLEALGLEGLVPERGKI
jgi:hypothetical protein